MNQPNPDSCAEVPTDCCPNPLSETLTATLENVSGCQWLVGQQVTLRYNAAKERWETKNQTIDCQGTSYRVSVDIKCDGDVPEDFDLTDFDCGDCGLNSGSDNPTTFECGEGDEDFKLTFDLSLEAEEDCDCCENENVTIRVIIEEA